jgi:hypothetical protein
MASTALQIVNRVLRKISKTTIGTSFSDTNLGNQALDAVNEAVRAIIDTHTWDSLKKRDGMLITKAELTATDTAAVVSGSASVTVTGTTMYTALSARQDAVVYLTVTSDGNYANTAFRVIDITRSSGNSVFTLADTPGSEIFPGTTDAAASVRVNVPEYVLPSFVKMVHSVRYEEEDIELRFVDETTRLDEVEPSLNEDTGSPEVIAVGGTSTGTGETSTTKGFTETTDGNDGTRLIVRPTPDEDYVLHYSYSFKPTNLVEVSDTLDGLTESMVDDVVLRATALMQLTTGESDVDLAQMNMQLSRDAVEKKRSASRSDAGRKRVIRSLDSKGGRRAYPNLPTRTYGSLDE